MNPPQVYMCSPSWTLLPPPSPFHPFGSSQCTSLTHPVSCIEPGLALVSEKTLESPLHSKEIKLVNSKGKQLWIFVGRTDTEDEVPIFWPPDAKRWLIGKDPEAGKDWRQKEQGMTEDKMVGWHHWLDGCESEWTPGVGDGRGGLVCCDSWGHKGRTRLSNWIELNW